MKPSDVYHFSYHPEPTSTHDRYWCFDGRLVVREYERDGIKTLILVDTYWNGGASSGSDGRCFTPEEAAKQGELTFICNLDEVEVCKDSHCYDPADVFDLSYQKGCYRRMAKRKGAERSRDAMKDYVRAKLTEARRKVDSATREVEWLAGELKEVEMASDLNKLYI